MKSINENIVKLTEDIEKIMKLIARMKNMDSIQNRRRAKVARKGTKKFQTKLTSVFQRQGSKRVPMLSAKRPQVDNAASEADETDFDGAIDAYLSNTSLPSNTEKNDQESQPKKLTMDAFPLLGEKSTLDGSKVAALSVNARLAGQESELLQMHDVDSYAETDDEGDAFKVSPQSTVKQAFEKFR